jgi:plastin-1
MVEIILTVFCRLNIVKTLTAISGNNKPISDTEILKWANGKVSTKPGTKTARSFKDPYISNGVWFLDLLDALKPGIVDYSLVTKDASDFETKRQNGT